MTSRFAHKTTDVLKPFHSNCDLFDAFGAPSGQLWSNEQLDQCQLHKCLRDTSRRLHRFPLDRKLNGSENPVD